jgi:putative two-component system response regulator
LEATSVCPTVLTRPTIMIVDDSEENLMIMKSILEQEFSVKLFSKAKYAIEYAIGIPPDLILLDVMMPDIDGYEACSTLKKNERLVDIPVIFITSKNEDEYEEKGFSVGAADFIHKPINAAILISRVKTHIKIKIIMDYLRNENALLKSGAQQASRQLEEITKMLWGSKHQLF